MLPYPDIDPILVELGPLKVHWYGTMYLVGFAMAWLLGLYRVRRPGSGWTGEELEGLIFTCAIALLVGARVGYMLFYNFSGILADPVSFFRVWQGGMSFHGGAVGLALAVAHFGGKSGKGFLQVADFLVPLTPLGLCAGRIGNFINGELWGRVTDVPWAMVFPTGGPAPRHPSQLYEAGLEGVLLFVVLWAFSRVPRPHGAVLGLFLLLYGAFRTFAEFFREPDQQLGYLAYGWLTMGQILSFPMVLLGGIMIAVVYARRARP